MRNDKYWANRMRILEEALLDTGYEYVKNLERQYDLAIRSLEKEIESWYQRFADENGITFAEARQMLTTKELDEFRWTVEEYIKHGQENAVSQAWLKQLKNASARVHISRLDSLKLHLQQQAEALHGAQSEALNAALGKLYEAGYYHTAYEIQRGIGVGWSLHGLTGDEIRKVLSRPWTLDAQTFSDRIWSNKEALVNTVNTELTQMIMRGSAPDKTIKAIAKRFDVSKSQAGRLVMTESAAFANEARKDCFRDLGVERYVIVETLDNDTCSLCGQLDGKVYPMGEYQVGVTAPPFHPWCRGTTAPYFEDLAGLGDRAARDNEGKVYDVPRGMTYRDWYNTTFTAPAEQQYNVFRENVHEDIRKNYPLKLNEGMQNKHIRDNRNFDPSRSELTADPQELIRLYAGKSMPQMSKSGAWNQKERFSHTSEIGIWRGLSGQEAATKEGIIHYSKKKGLHIVPAQPNKGGKS